VTVPIEATEEMTLAGADGDWTMEDEAEDIARAVYNGAIAARPR
jgi:hypothetical protein